MEFITIKISTVINANFFGKKSNSFSILSVDSRTIFNPSITLFIALVTKRNNGHKYIEELYKKGVRSFIVSDQKMDYQLFPEGSFLFVKDTLNALQQLAAYKRSLFHKKVIGITGSNGKTTVKEWLAQIMASKENVCASPKSYNSQIGVPLSVWNLKEKNTIGIFEAGISEPGEMKNLFRVIKPEHGIFTNLLSAHDENFESRSQKANEKLFLFSECKKIFFSADDTNIVICLLNQKLPKARLTSWTKNKTKNNNLNTVLKVLRIETIEIGTKITAFYKKKKIQLTVPFCDKASIENIIHCWLYLLENKYSNSTIQKEVLHLTPLEMRMELKKGINSCTIINDSYNSDIRSLSIALDLLNRQTQHNKKTIILSDILETGMNQKELYKEVAKLLVEKKINRVVGIGNNIFRNKKLFRGETVFFRKTKDFIDSFSPSNFVNEAVLLKGARNFSFEKIGVLLQEKSHDTILEINLNNLIHNLNYYRSVLNEDVKVMAMVKAFSYGSGSYEIASVLQHHGVNYLAVAYSDEGVELRKAGITLPIMVMNPEEQSFNDLVQYNLEPEIFSHRILDLFFGFLKEHKIKNPPGIHIKLDTGMHRLGFLEQEIPSLIEKLHQHSKIRALSIFSHFVGSDSLDLDDFTNKQITLFKKQNEIISKSLGYSPLMHLCNSSGITRFPEAHFNMVRLGIGLYGIGSDEEEKNNLISVASWKTKISQIKNLDKGHTVGYGRKGTVNTNSVIATVPVGYADGFLRKLSNGKGKMYINNIQVHVIGNVCMDMCMLDITEASHFTKIKEGDEVIIFDSVETLRNLSEDLNTIPYEILTSISPRVKRIYLSE